jgi:hypothetical protein
MVMMMDGRFLTSTHCQTQPSSTDIDWSSQRLHTSDRRGVFVTRRMAWIVRTAIEQQVLIQMLSACVQRMRTILVGNVDLA